MYKYEGRDGFRHRFSLRQSYRTLRSSNAEEPYICGMVTLRRIFYTSIRSIAALLMPKFSFVGLDT